MSNHREFVELDPALLPRLESLIENLIALCDQLAGDCDREDDAPLEDPELYDEGIDGEGAGPLPVHMDGANGNVPVLRVDLID